MITEWLVGVAAGFVGWIAGLFPAWNPPSWMTDQHGAAVTMLQTFTGLGVWVDWTALGICVSAVALVWVSSVGVRLVRAVIAHVPLFGGSGA